MIRRIKGLKRHSFTFWVIGIYCVLGIRALHFYANGQTIASAHLDSHAYAAISRFLVAAVLAVIYAIMFYAKQQKETLKWFWLPAIFAGYSGVHLYIGGLFICCPCCCTPRHVHEWNVVFAASLISLLVIALVIARQFRKSRKNGGVPGEQQ